MKISNEEINFPFVSHIGLTYSCNCHCRHCYANQRIMPNLKQMQKTDYFKLIDELYSLNTFSVTYSHGETLLCPFCFDILHYCRDKGLGQTLISNALLIKNIKHLNSLNDAGINSLFLSLDSLISEKHNNNRKNKDAFSCLMGAIKLLSSSNIKNKGIATSISEFNEEEIDDIINFCINNNIDSISILTERNNSMLCNIDLKSLSSVINKYKNKITIITHDYRLNNLRHNFNFLSPKEEEVFLSQNDCHFGKSILSIDVYGDVRACNFQSKVYGNFFNEGLSGIWMNILKSKKMYCHE